MIGEEEELIEFLPPEAHKCSYAIREQVAVRRSGRGHALTALRLLRDVLLHLTRVGQLLHLLGRTAGALDQQCH